MQTLPRRWTEGYVYRYGWRDAFTDMEGGVRLQISGYYLYIYIYIYMYVYIGAFTDIRPRHAGWRVGAGMQSRVGGRAGGREGGREGGVERRGRAERTWGARAHTHTHTHTQPPLTSSVMDPDTNPGWAAFRDP